MGHGGRFGALIVAALLLIQASVQQDVKIQTAEDLLITSVRTGDVGTVRSLLANGVSPDAATKFGTTVLWSACFRGSAEMVEALINAGANINLGNQKGTTPLFIASQMGHSEVVSSLVDAGADVNATSKSGGSALLVAAQENHPQVVKVLIESGANLNQKTDKTGQTALWTAAFKGHVEVVTLLVENGADIMISDETSGASPLYVSIRHDLVPIAQSLISQGADVNAGIGNGFTPIHLASALGSEASVRLLLENEAHPGILDHMGRSPVDVVGQARTDLPQAVYDRILKLLKQGLESIPVGMTRVGSRSNNAQLPPPMVITKSPETPPSSPARVGTAVLIPILTPVFGIITVVIAVVLIANMVRLRKIVKEEEKNSFRYGSVHSPQPMLIHNLAAAPPRGGSPRPESAYSPFSSCSSSPRSFGEGPSGLWDPELEVPNVQDHQPTHARGPSLNSVPLELVESAQDITTFGAGYWLERSDASSDGSRQPLVFKSASMRIKPLSEASLSSSQSQMGSYGSRPDRGQAFRSAAISASTGRPGVGVYSHQGPLLLGPSGSLELPNAPYPHSPFVMHSNPLGVPSDSSVVIASDSEADEP